MYLMLAILLFIGFLVILFIGTMHFLSLFSSLTLILAIR